MRYLGVIIAAGLLLGGAGPAVEAPDAARSEIARLRYPQPVRVGDLAGRQVLRDEPEQRVLGRVIGVTRGADGTLQVVMAYGGVFGFFTRPVAVPLAATAALGQFLVLKDVAPERLDGLPDAAVAGLLPAETMIQIGLARN